MTGAIFSFFFSNQRQFELSPFCQVPCSDIYKYFVAVLHFQKANFACQVEEEEIVF